MGIQDHIICVIIADKIESSHIPISQQCENNEKTANQKLATEVETALR
jgi:hypothetical protein